MKRPQVAIVSCGMGNLSSVANALSTQSCEVVIARSPVDLTGATHIVLPGVGAFADGMEKLRQGGWLPALQEEVRNQRKPFLGICLGMQLLATQGTEHGSHEGLGWIDGTVVRLGQDDPTLRVPHIGWNDVEVVGTPTLLTALPGPLCFYFVHSYALVPRDKNLVSGTCSYGTSFVAAVQDGNIHGVQFHPEKSHKVGLALLGNFVKLQS